MPRAEKVSHEEEAEATNKTVIGDVWYGVIVFVGAVEYHGDDGENQHGCFAVFAPIKCIC